ncbi:MAG: RNA-binding protein [Bacteroidota bacterium]
MNMYVSNLGFHVTSEDLKQLFEPFGLVSSAKIISDRDTGRSRGFGFVEMASETEGKKAMAGVSGKEIEGRTISVGVAKERERTNDRRRW